MLLLLLRGRTWTKSSRLAPAPPTDNHHPPAMWSACAYLARHKHLLGSVGPLRKVRLDDPDIVHAAFALPRQDMTKHARKHPTRAASCWRALVGGGRSRGDRRPRRLRRKAPNTCAATPPIPKGGFCVSDPDDKLGHGRGECRTLEAHFN
jgi:hypothetical protein